MSSILDISKNLHIKCSDDWEEVCNYYGWDMAQNGGSSYTSVWDCNCLEAYVQGEIDGQVVAHSIFYNIREEWIESDGLYDIQCYDMDEFIGVKSLEDLFQHPLFPTQAECEMFLLEQGFAYPIPCDTLTSSNKA